MTPTITCPQCGMPHALFWMVDARDKRRLYYTCDRVPVKGPDKYGAIRLTYHTNDLPVYDYIVKAQYRKDTTLPERWSSEKRKKEKEASECNLPLNL